MEFQHGRTYGTQNMEHGECARRVKLEGAALTYVLCPHLTDERAFQFMEREKIRDADKQT